MRLYSAIGRTLDVLDPAVYTSRPRALADATTGSGDIPLRERHGLRKRASALSAGPGKPSREELSAALTDAADQLAEWERQRLPRTGSGGDEAPTLPRLPAGFAELARLHAEISGQLAALGSYVRFPAEDTDQVLAAIRVRDPRYAAERGDALDEVASDFRDRDIQYLAANRRRVRHAWAERLREAQDLPAARLFDVVIFDEASQIVPADAIPSIMRGHQIVVAGDDRQLPPTNSFRQVGDGDDDPAEDDEDALVSFGAGFESVLDALRPLLPTSPLAWHYRSRDERLVAFSNTHIYGGALTTFPGVFRDDCLRHVAVAQTPEPGQEVSVTAEVHRVVELILEHARTRPHESLGVIALGIRHAERIDAALRTALAGQPALEDFFADDSAEPFFVKNLERVQGDERDAIILSIGYGKHPDGRMRYQWGPLLRDGGERDNRRAAVRRRRLPGRLRGHPSRRRRSDGTGDRGGRSVVPSVGQRPRSQPAAQRASSATRLAIPPSLVDQLVPRSAERGRQAPGGL